MLVSIPNIPAKTRASASHTSQRERLRPSREPSIVQRRCSRDRMIQIVDHYARKETLAYVSTSNAVHASRRSCLDEVLGSLFCLFDSWPSPLFGYLMTLAGRLPCSSLKPTRARSQLSHLRRARWRNAGGVVLRLAVEMLSHRSKYVKRHCTQIHMPHCLCLRLQPLCELRL